MRVGLRLRLTVAFAVGSLVLSAALAVLTYETARTYLLRQRESSAMRQAFVNARLLRTSLRGTGVRGSVRRWASVGRTCPRRCATAPTPGVPPVSGSR